MSPDISRNLEKVYRRIERAAQKASRDPGSIQLLAVSKTFSAAIVADAVAAGQKAFGENRVQEGESKIPVLEKQDLEWHLIGPLQSNKVKRAVRLFDVIQTVGRPKILRKISREAESLGQLKSIYIQCNIGGEEQKFGCAPEDAAELVKEAVSRPGLQVKGLMAIPPYLKDPEAVRPYFRQLRELRDRIQDQTGVELAGLSMGMSHDFEAAIEEGSTLIRVGTAIFGPRR
ncbi:MAG TPA: YggS family pyridoxal phosphate-dependent enzyme [Acidobacteriota bacterium]|nr:YggS family pyridoxal phosphate-dependent enzyme [Acidobacteriota bacterium]